MGGPAVGDIDGDGLLEVLIATRDGHVFAWSTDAPADGPAPWPLPRHDAAHTGNATVALPLQDGPRACGCASAPGAAWPSLALLALLALRRRR
jgi:MYXO-CTERM domain-containing protein